MNVECYSIATLPVPSRLYQDFCENRSPLLPFYSAAPYVNTWQRQEPSLSQEHRNKLADLLLLQPQSELARQNIEKLRKGAAAVVTGQQVALFGGPLFTYYKAAAAIRRAIEATEMGHPHVPIFWLATEDHDFAEINHVSLQSGQTQVTLTYEDAASGNRPVGGLVLGPQIEQLLKEAQEYMAPGEFEDLLTAAYKPGHTLGQAFAILLSGLFAAQGLIVLDASCREFHALGAGVLRQAIVQAEDLHQALVERNRQLVAAGYHVQVAVGESSSLLFLLDEATGARQALKRVHKHGETSAEWLVGRRTISEQELLSILEHEPERISPSALLRPVFQDAILPTSVYIGGPAELAYFAQSSVLYQNILGRVTPVMPRLSATLVEPAIAALLEKLKIASSDVMGQRADELALRLAARSMPVEGKQLLARAGTTLDAELKQLTDWMHSVDQGLGVAADTSARKMRYQMNRLRRMAANFQMQKEASLARNAARLIAALWPQGHAQERILGGLGFFSHYGIELAQHLVDHGAGDCPGHKMLYL